MSPAKKISVSLEPDIMTQLDVRGSRSTIVNRDLNRLYALYRRALKQAGLTVDEACLIVDALNGSLYNADTACLLWAGIGDACRLDGLDKKWNVDDVVLVEKLQNLNELQSMAVIDAAERFWAGPYRDMEIREAVKQVFGL